MADDTFELKPPAAGLKKRRTLPVLVKDGNRVVPSDRQFHPQLAAEYILEHGGKTRWMLVNELARTFYMRDSKSNCVRIRRRLHLIWDALLKLEFLLVYDMRRDGVQACKIYDPRSDEERQYLHRRLEMMAKTRQLKAEKLHSAISLAECLDATVAGA